MAISLTRALYTAKAHVTGGRAQGHGRTSDGALEVDLRLPPEMGGQGGGTNPKELFAVGYAAGFERALGAVARRRKVDAGDVAIDSEVTLYPNEDRGFQVGVELDVTLPSIEDDETALELVNAADIVCPYSNATRGNIELRLTANGAAAGQARSRRPAGARRRVGGPASQVLSGRSRRRARGDARSDWCPARAC
jgi:lipoyl-dependent peroxiredoxin